MFFSDTRHGSLIILSFSNWDKDKCVSCYILIKAVFLLVLCTLIYPLSTEGWTGRLRLSLGGRGFIVAANVFTHFCGTLCFSKSCENVNSLKCSP